MVGPRGADEVEFLFGANPGVPPRPLRETASGGELSRAMLAIRGIVTLGDDVETLIFDEVDTGIGGVTAAALGERLAGLVAASPGALHHPSASGRGLRRAAVRDRQGDRRQGRQHRHRRAARGGRGAPRRALPDARRACRRRRRAQPRGGSAGEGRPPGVERTAAPCGGPAPDGILASVFRGPAGDTIAPARQYRTGATPAPLNPLRVCSGVAVPCARLLVGAPRAYHGHRPGLSARTDARRG